MIIYHSLAEAKAAELRRPIATLGVFDGVHVGHRVLLDHVVTLAKERAVPSCVVTFSRHPRAVILGEAPKLITSLPHRLAIFGRLGISAALVLEFDDQLRQMSAQDFATEVFHCALHAQLVVLGYNNRFGKGGEGDLNLLQDVGGRLGFQARMIGEVRIGGAPLSSTAIREAVLSGDLERASLMLGRPFSVLGTVVSGDRIGRKLGFPTANLDLHHEVRPPRGVYGCEVELDGVRRHALVNIGVRPTITGASGETSLAWEARDSEDRIEAFLLDYDGEIYGRELELIFLLRIRDERMFDGLEALKAQIRADEAQFRHFLVEE